MASTALRAALNRRCQGQLASWLLPQFATAVAERLRLPPAASASRYVRAYRAEPLAGSPYNAATGALGSGISVVPAKEAVSAAVSAAPARTARRCYSLLPASTPSSEPPSSANSGCAPAGMHTRSFARMGRQRTSDNPRQRTASAPQSATEAAKAAQDEALAVAEPITLPPMRWDGEPDQQIAHTVGHRALVICREIEWATVIIGFEQANKYTVRDERGDVVAYIAEETTGMGNAIGRQILGTHRSFVATVMDANGEILMRVKRPIHLINSQMNIENADGEQIGEVVQRWHLWKRNYDLYQGKRQFASITGSFLAWEFELKDEHGGTLALIDRNFLGFGRELFTDAGKYVVHFGMPPDTAAEQATVSRHALVAQQAAKDGKALPEVTALAKLRTDAAVIPTQNGNQLEVVRNLKLSERAIALACAITIDFDYFSQHSGSPGILGHTPLLMPMPMPIPSGGGEDGAPGGVDPSTAPPPPPPPPGPDGETPSEDLGGDEFPGHDEFEHDLGGDEFDDDEEGGRGLFGKLMDVFGED